MRGCPKKKFKRKVDKMLTNSGGGGGKIPSRLHLVEHQSRLDANQKRQRIAQDACGWIQHPDPEHWVQKSSTGGGNWTAPSEQATFRTDYRKSESKICYQPEMVTETSRLDSTNPNTRTSRPTIQNHEAMDARQSKLGDTSQEPTTEFGTKRVFSKLIV